MTTTLRRLELGSMSLWENAWGPLAGAQGGPGALGLERTLRTLGPSLTALCLSGSMPKPLDPRGALEGCARLRSLWVATRPATFGPDGWPAGLQAAHTSWDAVLRGTCTWGDHVGEELCVLSIDPCGSLGALVARSQDNWRAFWAWAAAAPALRLLEVRGLGGSVLFASASGAPDLSADEIACVVEQPLSPELARSRRSWGCLSLHAPVVLPLLPLASL